MNNTNNYFRWAKYYDRVYHWKNYKSDAELIDSLIIKFKDSDGYDLLEAACGTGNYLGYLKRKYDAMGFDNNNNMLAIAKKKHPELKLLKRDMRDFDLGKRFDAVVCLFASIAYMKNYNELNKAIKNFVNHLKTGGVLIIEPFVEKKDFRNKSNHHDLYKDDNIIISRTSTANLKGDAAVIDFHFVIAEKGKMKHFTDKHYITMFEIPKFKKIMKENHLIPYYMKHPAMGRGIYIGVKK